MQRLLNTHFQLDSGLLALLLFALLLGAALALVWARAGQWRKSRAIRERFAEGRKGEARAVHFVESRGYRVLDSQVRLETGFWVDEQWTTVQIRADMLVEKGGRSYVVEVKTGQQATKPTATATRRQLLEYYHAFEVDGLLLADMEHKALYSVVFPNSKARADVSNSPRMAPFLLGLVFGAFLGLALTLGLLV